MALAVVALLTESASAQREGPTSCVLRAELHGVVTDGMATSLERAAHDAYEAQCTALLVSLDTPGGSLEATRHIVSVFLDAPVPIVVYVSPAAARAGSAGMFVVIAAHVAAMAPGSSIGAAHPVLLSGGDPDEAGEEVARKIESDAAALARSIATYRARNVDWAQAAVRESASATASEAFDLRVIDIVAASERELLDQLDGRVVTLTGGHEVTLATANAEVRRHAMTVRERALALLGDPSVALVLLMIGVLGILLELSAPGISIPGALGVLSMGLAAIGLGLVPIQWGALAFLAIGIGLLVAELWVTSYGVLAAGGIAFLGSGAMLLYDASDPSFFADATLRPSLGLLLLLAIVLGLAAAALGLHAARARRWRSPTGADALVGAKAAALTPIDAHGGAVRLGGERWRAVSEESVPADAPVTVVSVEGLTLHVAREPQGGPA